MNSFFTYALTTDQYRKANNFKANGVASPTTKVLGFTLVVILFAAFGFLVSAGIGRSTVPGQWVLIAAVVAAAASTLLNVLARYSAERAVGRSTYMTSSPYQLAVSEAGMRLQNALSDVFHPWSAFSDVKEHDGIVYVNLDNIHYYPIPSDAFGSDDERRKFMAFSQERISASPARPSPTPAQSAGEIGGQNPPPLAQVFGKSRWKMATDAVRLAFLLPVAADRMAASWPTIIGIGVVAALIPSLPAFWTNPLAGEWSWFAVPSAVFHLVLLLIAAVVSAAALGRREDVPRILLAGILAAAVIDVLFTGLVTAVQWVGRGSETLAWRFGWVPGAWLALSIATYAARSVPRSMRRLGVLVASLVLVAYPLANVYRERTVWQVRYDPDDTQSYRAGGVAGEDIFYKQPVLLAQELKAIQPGTKGVIDLFFLGMAGYGSQDVFMREVNSVAGIFRDRFGTDGRTVRLINNPKTLLDTPVASKTSLKQALKRISDVMDKDEDILVLFMTSHGSEKHIFTLQLWPMNFHEVDPATLRSLLDESGIRNRVVIVSACYSGGFVKALENPDTLVITASAPDKNSFGCTNEAEWTYFGKAYFDDALRKTRSFTAAFRIAKPEIEARERREKYDHSEPQMSIGHAIAARLDALQIQQEGRSPGASTVAASPTLAPPDRYEEYVRLMHTDDYLGELLMVCRQNMTLNSPDETVRSNPGSFDGMEKSRPHWNRLATSWNSYVEGVCNQSLDPALIRRIYAENVRRVMSREEVDAAVQLISTDQGRRWLDKDREASRRQQLELTRVQTGISSALYQKFRQEQDRIYKEFKQRAN